MANNIVEFFEELKDVMNSSLAKMWQAAQSSLEKMVQTTQSSIGKVWQITQSSMGKMWQTAQSSMGKMLQTAQSSMGKIWQTTQSSMGMLWQTTRSSMGTLFQGARQFFSSVAKTAGQMAQKAGNLLPSVNVGGILKSASGSVGGILKSVSGSVFGSIAGLFSKANLAALGAKIVSGGMKQEKDIATLQPFLGKPGAQDAYTNIKSDAASTPFDTESLLLVNKSLIQAGANAKNARLDALALANAVTSTGGGNEQLSKMADLMGQIKKAGKATSSDLKQFSDAGIDIYKALAAASGRSEKQLKNMSVGYEGLSYSLRKAGADGGVFAGAMENQNQTVAAKWENLTETLLTALGDVGVQLMPLFGRALDLVLKLVSNLLPQIMQFIQPVIDIINSLPIEDLLNGVMGVATAMFAAIGPIFEELQPLFVALFETLWPLIQQMQAFTINLITKLAPILAVIAHIATAILAPALRFLGMVLGRVFDDLSKAVDFIAPILKEIADFVSTVVDGIMQFFGLTEEKKSLTLKLIPASSAKNTNAFATDFAAPKSTGLAALNNNLNKPKPFGLQAEKTAGEITSGGPRVININGVKFTDKIEIHVADVKDRLDHLEVRLQEMFLRILNSGAVLQ